MGPVMNVQTILDTKGRDVVTVRPETPMRSFGEILVERGIGAAPVTDRSGALLGIISERDLVRGFYAHGAALEQMTVGDHMTKTVVTCGTENTVADVVGLMCEHNIRHVAVLDADVLSGFISIRDVAFNRLAQVELDNEVLRHALENCAQSSHSGTTN